MDDDTSGRLSPNHEPGPAMSIVLATPDCYATIRRTVSFLRAQTVAVQLELIIVCPSVSRLHTTQEMNEDANDLSVFHTRKAIEVGSISSVSQANAAGARISTAPVIVFAEDHCFPDSDWAEALIRRHAEPWAAVGPCMANANPENSISFADLFIAYAPWVSPGLSGEVGFVPGHNSSYKREVLLHYGDRLEEMLQAEYLMHADMQARGLRMYLETGATTAHTNFSLVVPFAQVNFHSGRSFAAVRAASWSAARRLFYTIACPLIPLVRLQRITRQALQSGVSPARLLYALPAMLLGLLMNGIGEGIGYCAGSGNSRQRLVSFEFHRYQYTVSGQKSPRNLTPDTNPLAAR